MVKAVGRIDIYCVISQRGYGICIYVYMVASANADCLTREKKTPPPLVPHKMTALKIRTEHSILSGPLDAGSIKKTYLNIQGSGSRDKEATHLSLSLGFYRWHTQTHT